MEHTKDEVFDVRYQTDVMYQTKQEHKIVPFLKKHYFMGGLTVIAVLLFGTNLLFIYHFVNLLTEL